jgi:hypothetical protein
MFNIDYHSFLEQHSFCWGVEEVAGTRAPLISAVAVRAARALSAPETVAPRCRPFASGYEHGDELLVGVRGPSAGVGGKNVTNNPEKGTPKFRVEANWARGRI